MTGRASVVERLPGAGISRLAQFTCLLAFAALIRCPAYGEWNFGIDDQFYALVGDQLRHGELLYVDIWDRKGPLLYLIFAGIGLHAMRSGSTEQKAVVGLVVLWALAALTLIFSFPNIYVHYAQSALAPLAILCAGYFEYRRPVWPGIAAIIGLSLVLAGTFHLGDRWRARPAARALADYVREVTPGKRLFVWGAPSYLYTKVGADPASPLAFAPHIYEGREWTGLNEAREVRRILAARPETVVAQTPLPSSPLNETTVRMVDAYTAYCRKARLFTIYDHNGEQAHTVYSGCAQ